MTTALKFLCISLLVQVLQADVQVLQAENQPFHLDPDIPTERRSGIGYDQPHRPQFHFTSEYGWLNDPNGMIHDGEKYHLFFQHNPKGIKWGNMTWGHATSTDLLHWQQQDHALVPYFVDGARGTIFSGTAVLDRTNTLGLQETPTPVMAAFYTFAKEPYETEKTWQGMAISHDLGATWRYHNEGRANLPHQGFDLNERDPKVLWHEPTQQWVMLIWLQDEDPAQQKKGTVRFFTSENLQDWQHSSDFLRPWVHECMDLVQLPVDGRHDQKKWVIYDASFEYEIGDFDGRVFTSSSQTLRQQRDKKDGAFYAAQTFNHSPDGRTIIIGWLRGGFDIAPDLDMPFNQQMSFPAEMTLRTTPDGLRLFLWPIEEIASLVTKTHSWTNVDAPQLARNLADIAPLDLIDVEMQFAATDEAFTIDFGTAAIRWNPQNQHVETRRAANDWRPLCGPLTPRDGLIDIRLLIDRMSIEAYAFDGLVTGSRYIDPRHFSAKVKVDAPETFFAQKMTIRRLRSIWHSAPE